MSLRGRVRRLFAKFDRRVTLVEDCVERVEVLVAGIDKATQRATGAVNDMLQIGTDLKATAALLRRGEVELRTAVAELGRTVHEDLLKAMADERERRAGLGADLMELKYRVAELEGRANGSTQ